MRRFVVLSSKERLSALAYTIGLLVVWFFISDEPLNDWLSRLGWKRLAWGVWELDATTWGSIR